MVTTGISSFSSVFFVQSALYYYRMHRGCRCGGALDVQVPVVATLTALKPLDAIIESFSPPALPLPQATSSSGVPTKRSTAAQLLLQHPSRAAFVLDASASEFALLAGPGPAGPLPPAVAAGSATPSTTSSARHVSFRTVNVNVCSVGSDSKERAN